MKKPLTKTIKYCYGVANFGYTLANNIELLYFTFFCTNIAQFSLGTAALIGTISAVANTAMTPFYGAMIAKAKPMRWGRFRSWMVLMPPLAAVFYAMEFSRISFSQVISAAVVIIGTVMFDQVYSLAVTAHDSLINYIANNEQERAYISSRRGVFMSVANIANSYLGAPLAAVFAVWVGETYGYTLLAFCLAAIMTLTYWFTVRITRGYEPIGGEISQEELDAIEVEERITLREMFTAAVGNRDILAIIIADTLRYLSYNVLIASVVYYFMYIAQDRSLQAPYLVLGGITQLAGAYIATHVAKKFPLKQSLVVALLSVGALEILARCVGFNVAIVFAVLLIYRTCHGISIALFPAVIADTAAYEKAANGTPEPFTIGVIAIAPKIASLLRSWIIPAVLAIVGFSASVTPADATYDFKIGVLNMFLLIPGCMSILSGMILLLFLHTGGSKKSSA